MMKLTLMVKVAHFALCVDKILFYEDLTRNRDVEAEKEWQPNQRSLLNKGKKFTFKTTNL
jgi:hypothetical protein